METWNDVIERIERRRLFFSAMRRPEMRVLRAALWEMRWEHDIDWRDLTKLEIESMQHLSDNDATWMLTTDHHLIYCMDPASGPFHFYVVRLHDDSDPCCECEWCHEQRICHVGMREYYSQWADAYPVG
jgi:hypothetical protein